MNPAAEARGKAQAIWPGASVSARTRNGIKHQHPGHTGFQPWQARQAVDGHFSGYLAFHTRFGRA